MGSRVRPYLFYDVAISICSTCFRRVDAKIVFENDCVFLLKQCPAHGHERVLVADDVDYYRRCREVFETRFPAARMADDYLAVYGELIDQAHTRARRAGEPRRPAAAGKASGPGLVPATAPM